LKWCTQSVWLGYENDVKFLIVCVDMSEQDPTDPSKVTDGRRAQTQSYRKEKERRNAHIPKRGRGRRGMVQGLLRLHSLKSHRLLTRPRWSTWIIRIRYTTMSLMVGITRIIYQSSSIDQAMMTLLQRLPHQCYLWSLPFLEDRKIYLCCTLMPIMWHCRFGIIQIT